MFQRYKYIFIAAGIAIIIIVTIVVFFWIRSSRNNASPVQNVTALQMANFPGSAIKTEDQGTGKIIWQTEDGPVEMADIFKYQVQKNQYGDPESIDLSETNQFVIKYLFDGDYFTVNLKGSDLKVSRLAAEQEIIKVLQVDKSKICNLFIFVAPYVPQQEQTINYGLSFCPGSIKLPK